MKIKKERKFVDQKAQTAIEYLLLLTIAALIVFASFNTFFSPGGRVQNGLDLYFNKVGNGIMGNAPVLSTTSTVRSCAENTTSAACNFYASRCIWVDRYFKLPYVGGCQTAPFCADRSSNATCENQSSPDCKCRCTNTCSCYIYQDRESCAAQSNCAWFVEIRPKAAIPPCSQGLRCMYRSDLAYGDCDLTKPDGSNEQTYNYCCTNKVGGDLCNKEEGGELHYCPAMPICCWQYSY